MNHNYSQIADDFIARIRAATITPTTEVEIVYYCVDEHGNDVPPFRMSVVPLTTVNVEGDPELSRQWATEFHLHDIIANINSAVRGATTNKFAGPRNAPKIPMRLVRMELEINDIPTD